MNPIAEKLKTIRKNAKINLEPGGEQAAVRKVW